MLNIYEVMGNNGSRKFLDSVYTEDGAKKRVAWLTRQNPEKQFCYENGTDRSFTFHGIKFG